MLSLRMAFFIFVQILEIPMEKIDSLNQVAEFHKTFNAPILDTPQIPSKERAALRVSLLHEEPVSYTHLTLPTTPYV